MISPMHSHAGNQLGNAAHRYNTDEGTLTVILQALEQNLNHDIRDHMTKPLFQTGKTSIEALKVGDNMTGVVSVSAWTL